MNFFSVVKDFFEDLCGVIRVERGKAVLFSLVSVTGVACGVILYGSGTNWWSANRDVFAEKLLTGSFSLFFSFACWYILLACLLIFCNMCAKTRCLTLVVCFVFCVYCGANVASLFVLSVSWTLLYLIVVAIEQVIAIACACFLTYCQCVNQCSFRESFDYLNVAMKVVFVAFVAKILCFFVILGCITTFI